MGLKISDIIPRKSIVFEQLANKKIAVDFSNAAYQFLSSIRQRDGTPLMDSNGNITSHLQGILSRSCNLLQQNIKICYVFDGKPPELKNKTQTGRQERKEIAKEKLKKAKEDGNEQLMLRYSKQTTKLTQDMVDESKELIEALGMPIIQAPSEADAQIAHCCKKEDVWAAGTSDLDLLLHKCPRIITNLTLSQRRKLASGAYVKISPELVELNNVLTKLNINQEQLICLGILVGTDYNKGIHGIGQKKALKIVQELKTPEKIFSKHKVEWQQIFNLFNKMKIKEDYSLKWSQPNTKKVISILVDKHDFSEQRVLSTLEKFKEAKKQQAQKGLDSWM